ncbi:MAG: hypothetical protein WCO02_12440 [Bacteroidota bacterium]
MLEKLRTKAVKLIFKEDFAEIFFIKEGKELLGRSYTNFWFLFSIFFLTFFAIGFANGSLKYLEEKMSSPFIKWVSIDVPLNKTDQILGIQKKLNEDSLSKHLYSYKTVTGYNLAPLRFWDKKKNGTRPFNGRSIEVENRLLDEIFSTDNLVYGRMLKSNDEIGLIVTEKLLKKIGLPVKSGFIMMAFSDDINKDIDREIALPVIAVVKELPDLCDFVTTQYFQNQRQVGIDIGNPFNPGLPSGVSLITMESRKKAEKLKTLLQDYFKTKPEFAPLQPWIEVREITTSFLPAYQLTISLMNDSTLAIRDRVFNSINAIPEIRKSCFRFYDYTTKLSQSTESELQYDRLTIEFENLDKIGEFKEFLRTKFSIVMDMAQVEALKNYNFVSKLTKIISLILIAFSILSICLFVSNLLRNHLQKIKMNIGTFNAFGIDPKILERVYLSIVLSVIACAMISGLVIAWLIGGLGGIRGILYLLNSTLEEGQDYFELINYWTLVSVLSVLVIGYISLKYTAHRIFRQTPGDLIYDRL